MMEQKSTRDQGDAPNLGTSQSVYSEQTTRSTNEGDAPNLGISQPVNTDQNQPSTNEGDDPNSGTSQPVNSVQTPPSTDEGDASSSGTSNPVNSVQTPPSTDEGDDPNSGTSNTLNSVQIPPSTDEGDASNSGTSQPVNTDQNQPSTNEGDASNSGTSQPVNSVQIPPSTAKGDASSSGTSNPVNSVQTPPSTDEGDASNSGTSQPLNLVQTPPSTGGIKLWSILSKAAYNCNEDFTDTLKDRIQDLNEVYTSNESNTDLVFCPVESEAATDIENALKKFTDCSASNLKVLVVLHNTFDPEKTIQDSSRFVKRTDILTVDCLYEKDTGLLECQKNYDAMDKVVTWLLQQAKEKCVSKYSCQKFNKTTRYYKETEALKKQTGELKTKHKKLEQEKKHLEKEIVELKSMNKQLSDKQNLQENLAKYQAEEQETQGKQQPMFPGEVKLFSMLTGKTNNSHKGFIDTLINHIQDLREVPSVDESHVVLVFCPIVSRAGTDIEAALKTFTDSIASKLKVLVVLHHTFDPEKTVPDSSRCVNRTDILTVDCLFYEDTGLLKCQKNHDAIDKAVNWLIQQGKGKPGVNIYPRQYKSAGNFLSTITSHFTGRNQGSSSYNLQQKRSTSSTLMSYSVIPSNDTHTCDKDFQKYLKEEIQFLKKVSKNQESDIILHFLLFSPHQTAAVKDYYEKSGKTAAAVVVILHQTSDSSFVPKSISVNNPNVLTVDCVFCAGEKLPLCKINQDAISKVSKWLRSLRTMEQNDTEGEHTPV